MDIGNGDKTYTNKISKIHKLLQKIISVGKLIKNQWIPSHIIPENNISDKKAKMAGNQSDFDICVIDSGLKHVYLKQRKYFCEIPYFFSHAIFFLIIKDFSL